MSPVYGWRNTVSDCSAPSTVNRTRAHRSYSRVPPSDVPSPTASASSYGSGVTSNVSDGVSG